METNKIKLPISGKEVELKEYVNAREKRSIRDILLQAGQFGADANISQVKPEIINKAEDKAFQVVVLSIDGNKENILNQIMEMHSKDYEYLLVKVNDITEGLTLKKNL